MKKELNLEGHYKSIFTENNDLKASKSFFQTHGVKENIDAELNKQGDESKENP